MFVPIPHIINIDLASKINMNQSINIKKNDTNSHKFVVNIFNSGVNYDLTGTTSRIYFEKSDATKVFLDCVLDDTIVNKLSCLLTTQALTCSGSVASEITIYGSTGEILTSVTFNFIVSEVIRDDMAIESTSEFTALTNALNAVDDAVLSIPTVEALNVDLQNNIVTGDALDTTLKADISTGNILDAELKGDITTGDITDAALKADIIIAGQNEFATEITNARKGEVDLPTKIGKIDSSLADNVTQLALKATTANYTAAVTTTWVGASAPFTQTVAVTGILASDTPIVFPDFSTINATAILEQAAWDLIGEITTGADSIIIECFEELPITSLNIFMKVVR